MPDYRIVKYPARLKAQPLTEGDAASIPLGTGHVGVGMGGKGEPAQLDLVYSDGRTVVYPQNGPASLKPWAFKDAISPDDCVAWCRAQVGKAADSDDETEAA